MTKTWLKIIEALEKEKAVVHFMSDRDWKFNEGLEKAQDIIRETFKDPAANYEHSFRIDCADTSPHVHVLTVERPDKTNKNENEDTTMPQVPE